MPRVPFPTGLSGVEHVAKTRRALVNCFNNGKGEIISRPGIAELNETTGVARGSFVWNDDLYMVFSNALIKITNTDTGAFSNIGSIAGSGDIRVAVGFNTAVIVVNQSNGRIYTLDKSDVLTDITSNDNFVSCSSVANMDGRFIYIPFDGDPAFFSDVGAAGTVQALSFFDAEELPDENRVVVNSKNILWIGGTDSFEFFQDTGASPNPFQRVSGSRANAGFIGGMIEFTDAFMFVGREKDQDFGIFTLSQGGVQKISNETIDLILSSYSQNELATVVGERLKWRGYDLAIFKLPYDSFGFYAGNWFVLESLIDGISRPWLGGFIAQFDGKYYSASGDKIGVFENVTTDFGSKITRTIDTGFAQEDDDWFACQSIGLGISQGFGTSPGTVAISLSKDNITFGQPIFRDLGALGNYADKLKWNESGGMGSYDGFMGIRIYATGNVEFSADFLTANFRG